jgi:hypothetical protein
MGPNQSAILSGGFSPWQAPLAALFSGISAAAQPGGFANFGQGVQQGQQNFQQGQQQQQMMDLRRMQMEQAQEEQRRANQEREQAQAQQDRIRQSIARLTGSPTPTEVQPVGNYGAATGGIQTASGAPGGQLAAIFGGDQQKAALFSEYAEAYPEQAYQMLVERGFAEPDQYEASSPQGKLKADLDAGLIDQATYDALLKKETYIPPREGPAQTERYRNAVAAGLVPGTPEFQQYMLGRDDTAPGPFQGTGLDAQSYNIVLEGDPASPQYAAAYAQLAMPKVTFDPVTQKMVSVAPDMSWARPPAGAAAPTTPSAQPKQTGTDTMQLPGATVTSTQGAPIYNEGQGKAATFSDRMIQSEDSFEKFKSAGMDRTEGVLGKIPFVGNSLVSKERQQFDQAERNFINAQLRRESGAVISPEEFADARKQYIPQPGDDEATLAQKAESRRIAREGMARESGPFYKPGGEDYQSMYGLTPTN